MTKAAIDKIRVLAALKANPRGLTRVDFQAPHVVDGGDTIINIPARIYDLREDGHEIVAAGKRDGCRVYRLVSVVPGTAVSLPTEQVRSAPVVADAVPEPTQLPVTAHAGQRSMYDPWSDAA